MNRTTNAALVLACFSLASCAFVKPSVDSHEVALRDASFVENCQKLGSTTSKTLQKMWVVSRGDAKVINELVTLAKNEAVVLGGDTIVAESEIEEGKQVFGVYRCN